MQMNSGRPSFWSAGSTISWAAGSTSTWPMREAKRLCLTSRSCWEKDASGWLIKSLLTCWTTGLSSMPKTTASRLCCRIRWRPWTGRPIWRDCSSIGGRTFGIATEPEATVRSAPFCRPLSGADAFPGLQSRPIYSGAPWAVGRKLSRLLFCAPCCVTAGLSASWDPFSSSSNPFYRPTGDSRNRYATQPGRSSADTRRRSKAGQENYSRWGFPRRFYVIWQWRISSTTTNQKKTTATTSWKILLIVCPTVVQ